MLDKFLKNKIQRQINQNGSIFCFYRYEYDKYSKKQDTKKIIEMSGLFHNGRGTYSKQISSEGGRVTEKENPMILCLFEDGLYIKKDDEVKISGKIYFVVHKENIQNLNIVFDISLEEKR